ncbi:major facilitator superfamily domain-containing protein [Lipomyces tetrasporus]|uniref:Major facilitator superfamily domain-containing protein n=1 Tax=Lipomyces tetrasporus TaxID=54092 RepID=A0AAD7QRL7_9ASCO|nr:major facilitator superfamily domain-containing protein [Lipomyces tetrasporus]KAJ8100130.1 major facilitator superfamily domain-containing protein [Lipomyces tetrasporus]
MAVVIDNSADVEKAGYPASDTTVDQQKTSSAKAVDLDALAKELGVDPRRLLWKIDVRLVPMLCILYLMAFLDRVNISNAALFSMKTDLGIETGTRYNVALTIFFVPYILCEIPSNVLMKKFRPHVWLPICMFSFGLVTCLQGLVQNYSGLLATRFFLGMSEAGMFPGCFYLIAMWYVRSEAQKRYSFFFSSTTLAGGFGGLLASAIGLLDGKRGYHGWRWIFIIEGAVTCVIALTFFFLIVDFPEEARFLTANERAYVKAKLAVDVGDSQRTQKTTVKDVLEVFKDYKIYLAGFMYFGLIVPSYGYAYFAPAIIKQLGYSTIQAQLHSVPPWAAACGASMISSVFSDYFRHRYLFTMSLTTIAIVGFGILLGEHHNVNTQYAALFLCALGLYSSMPIIVCWTTTNFGGHTRRGVGAGWQVGFGNIGGIIATFSFLATDAPRYTKGYSIGIGFAVLSMISCTIYLICTQWENRQRDKGIGIEQWEQLTTDEKSKAGDQSPYFRYGS